MSIKIRLLRLLQLNFFRWNFANQNVFTMILKIKIISLRFFSSKRFLLYSDNQTISLRSCQSECFCSYSDHQIFSVQFLIIKPFFGQILIIKMLSLSYCQLSYFSYRFWLSKLFTLTIWHSILLRLWHSKYFNQILTVKVFFTQIPSIKAFSLNIL